MSRTLVRTTRLNKKLGNIKTHTCTIQNFTTAKDDYQQDIKSWVDLADHVDLDCFMGNESGGELLQPNKTQKIDSQVINIIGYKPLIKSSYRAIVDSVTYNILDVGFDPSKSETRLSVEVVTI